MYPTQFLLEPDITPLDSRGEELETNFNRIDRYIYIRKRPDVISKLRLSERTTELVTKLNLLRFRCIKYLLPGATTVMYIRYRETTGQY